MPLRRLLPAALVLLAACAALAAVPPDPPSTKEFYSPNRMFVAISEPDSDTVTIYSLAGQGGKSKLWSMEGWERAAWLADDGEHLVAAAGWYFIPKDFERNMTILRFYKKGKLIKRVGLDEIVGDQTRFEEAGSFYFWGVVEGMDEMGRIVVLTVEKKALVYDAATGDLVETRDFQDDEEANW